MTLVNKLIEQLPNKTYLRVTDYNDELPINILGNFISTNGADSADEQLSDSMMDWDTSYAIDYDRDEAIQCLAKQLKLSKHDLIELLDAENEDWRDNVRETIEERDASTPIQEMARRTDNVILRLEMVSGNDCINSAWCEGKVFDLEDSYLADVLRVLRINPKHYADYVTQHEEGFTFLNVADVYRGQPLIEAKDVFEEHRELSSGPALLTIVFSLPATEVLDFKGFVRVPAGAKVGFFSSAVGAASLFDVKLQHEFNVDLANQPVVYTEPTWMLAADEDKSQGYSLDNTCGFARGVLDVEGSIYPELQAAA